MLKDILNRARLKKAKLSLVRSETYERKITKDEVKATAVIQGESDPKYLEAYVLMRLFHRLMSDFDGTADLTLRMSTQAKTFWTRVRKAQVKSGVDEETYLKAQFAWFSKVHGCAPEPTQLATDNAILRAKDYALTQFTHRRVIGNGKILSVEMADLFKACELQIQQLMKAHGLSRKDVYEQFVLTGAVHISQSFLDLDPVYIGLCNG